MTTETMDPTVELEGDTWRIIGIGRYDSGVVLCHLASTTQFQQQRNGKVPKQIVQDLPESMVAKLTGVPTGFYTWNRSLQGAFRKGMQAAQDGETRDTCPYRDKRKPDGRLTWSRAYRTAWFDGFDFAGKRALADTGGKSPLEGSMWHG